MNKNKATKKTITLQPGQIWLGKYLATCAVASRRQSTRLVQDGYVTVDGKPVFDPGKVVEPARQEILFDGQSLTETKNKVYYALNKPEGVVTTMSDPDAFDTVGRLIEKKISTKVFPVGRLDCQTSGLLLLTNDGDFANMLTHPSFKISKTYLATLDRPIEYKDLPLLAEGLRLRDGFFKPDALERGGSRKEMLVTIHSGRNRIIRRFFEAFGYEVATLVRIKFGNLDLDKLALATGRLVKIKKEWILAPQKIVPCAEPAK